jgi:hypothetical protein
LIILPKKENQQFIAMNESEEVTVHGCALSGTAHRYLAYLLVTPLRDLSETYPS